MVGSQGTARAKGRRRPNSHQLVPRSIFLSASQGVRALPVVKSVHPCALPWALAGRWCIAHIDPYRFQIKRGFKIQPPLTAALRALGHGGAIRRGNDPTLSPRRAPAPAPTLAGLAPTALLAEHIR
jgi:hypothetical protein